MSNKRKLRPPPTGYSYEKFIRMIMEVDLPEETKEQILLQAAFADRKGRIRDVQSPVVPPSGH